MNSENNLSADDSQLLGQVSLRSRLLDAILNKTVLGVIITTIFGSLAVTIITSHVTKSLGESNLQFQAISALMDFTDGADIKKSEDILKLQALIGLVKENKELSVNVDGFEKIVSEFDKSMEHIKNLENTVKKKEEEVEKANSELSRLKATYSEDIEEQTDKASDLEEKIRKEEKKAVELSRSLYQNRQELKEARGEQLGSEAKLEEARHEIDRLKLEIKNTTSHQKIIVLNEKEEKPVKFIVETKLGTKGYNFTVKADKIADKTMTIVLNNKPYKMAIGKKERCVANTPFDIEVLKLINQDFPKSDWAVIGIYYSPEA